MALTKKQEIFCNEVLKQDTYSDAYRIAYDTKNMSDEVINKEASLLMNNRKITVRLQELKQKVENKVLYTIEQSINRDLKLIQRYESALDVLEDIKSNDNEITAAERTIKFIGSTGYNSAQDRLSKQHGFNEKDNSQSKAETTNIINLGQGSNPNESTT